MKISLEPFGTLHDGQQSTLYTIKNEAGMSISVCDYGACVVRVIVPDRLGKFSDVVLGFDSVTSYLNNPAYLGAICGRMANRIAKGKFTLHDVEYRLTTNNGNNTLHGGSNGFDSRLWKGEMLANGVRFSYLSPDGQEGFPGSLQVYVDYCLDDKNKFSIEYEMISDADTIVNLTNHTYFNLAGHNSGSIFEHSLQMFAEFYTPLTSKLVPTGEIRSVDGTPFDFRNSKPIGREIEYDCEQLKWAGGYDHNFVLDKPERDKLSLAARVMHEATGRMMEVWTTMPGIQFYTSNCLACEKGKNGSKYKAHDAFCLETQLFPDSMTWTHFPSPILPAKMPFRSRTDYRFLLSF